MLILELPPPNTYRVPPLALTSSKLETSFSVRVSSGDNATTGICHLLEPTGHALARLLGRLLHECMRFLLALMRPLEQSEKTFLCLKIEHCAYRQCLEQFLKFHLKALEFL